jgi:transglutaminase-like putative cysteine protease
MKVTQRYRVTHETVYHYGGNVAHSHQLLHLTPREFDRQQRRAHVIKLDPAPSRRHDALDAFGNVETRLEYDAPHDRLAVRSEMQVEVSAPDHAGVGSLEWRAVQNLLRFSGDPPNAAVLEAMRYRMESSYIKPKHVFADYAADCFDAHPDLLGAAAALMTKIHREFKYAPGTTHIRTSALEAFQARRGVCQDFAHIMIACLRSLGLAARYVSGYLRTTPPPGVDSSWVGADASHAWVSVFCPPLGWVDFDPTNDIQVGTGHIVVAWGRDFGDVSPLRGIIIGGGRHRLSVRVSVRAE